MPVRKWWRSTGALRGFALIACSSVAYLLAAEPALEVPELLVTSTPRDNAELVLVNLANGDELNLTRDPWFQGYPAWSSDGKKIAYCAAEATAMHIWTIDPDGKNRKQLTNEAAWDRAPAFSPNGQRIAFCRRVAGCAHPDRRSGGIRRPDGRRHLVPGC